MNFKAGCIAVLLSLICLLSLATPALAQSDRPDGAALFEQHCAGCHINGGNIVRRGKNLQQKTLERNGVASLEAIAQLVTQGKGIMSAYGDRLTPEDIQAVSAYVLERATQHWR